MTGLGESNNLVNHVNPVKKTIVNRKVLQLPLRPKRVSITSKPRKTVSTSYMASRRFSPASQQNAHRAANPSPTPDLTVPKGLATSLVGLLKAHGCTCRSAWLHFPECMVALIKVHGCTLRSPWLDFRGCYLALSGVHGSTLRSATGGLTEASPQSHKPLPR